ncbi:MAG: hypothetical protein J6P60_04150, partial [Lachnospiraceae bacterium]|nr:hypothetical protein [Lachnospiraceae bacterium]
MRQKIRQVGKKLYIFLKERYDKTDSAVYLLLLVNTFVVGGLCFLEIGIPRVAAFFLFGTLATLAVVLAVWIAGKLLKLFLYRGEKHLVTLSFLIVFICYFCLSAGMGIVPKWQSVVTAVVIFGIAVVFIRSLFALVLCKGKRRSVLAICTLSGLAFMLILLFVFSDGFDDTYVASYLMLGQDKGWDKAELLR